MQPLFIFSLPKSGSTLLQRILGASNNISTAAEPWILLPYIYALKQNGIVAEYWHETASKAIEDFIIGLPNGKKDYFNEIERVILNLYSKRSKPGSIYFLDKTPRYSIICKEIMALFPNGKFIFLWRNPLAIVSSMLQRWCKGKWKIDIYNIDLYDGFSNLFNAYISPKANIFSLNYENLIKEPEFEIKKICNYLNLNFENQMINNFYNTPLVGRMTEHTGSEIYRGRISKESLDKWKNSFNNQYRRYWAKKYLNWIGKERLKTIGYDLSDLESSLLRTSNLPQTYLLKDLLYHYITKCRNLISPFQKTRYKSLTHIFR